MYQSSTLIDVLRHFLLSYQDDNTEKTITANGEEGGQKSSGQPALSKIIEAIGWESFRSFERKILIKTLAESRDAGNVILDCGGGVVERCSDILGQKDCVPIWILRDIKQTFASLKERENFFVKSVADLTSVAQKRVPLYEQVAKLWFTNDALFGTEAEVQAAFVRWFRVNFRLEQPR